MTFYMLLSHALIAFGNLLTLCCCIEVSCCLTKLDCEVDTKFIAVIAARHYINIAVCTRQSKEV